MASNQIEIPCRDDCPLAGLTHQHFEKVEGVPKKKHKRRRFDDDNSEQNMLVKRKRSGYNNKRNKR